MGVRLPPARPTIKKTLQVREAMSKTKRKTPDWVAPEEKAAKKNLNGPSRKKQKQQFLKDEVYEYLGSYRR